MLGLNLMLKNRIKAIQNKSNYCTDIKHIIKCLSNKVTFQQKQSEINK